MTQTDLATSSQVTAPATALAAMLESTGTKHELTVYRGALTPRLLDAPETETEALVSGAAVHDLGWMRRVAVLGKDRFRWLSGMVTNTVKDLTGNTGAWNFVLNAQGRIQGDLTAWREDDALELEIAADQYGKLLAHLNHFIIMDDVELAPLGTEQPGEAGSETAVGLSGPLADEVLARLGMPSLAAPLASTRIEWNGMDLKVLRGYGALVPHYEFWAPTAGLPTLWAALRTAGAVPVGCASLDAFRIAEGIPVYGVDIAERDLPQETSQLRALHFKKGCYLGQEIVERIRSRGNVHRHLRQVELLGPLPEAATELTLEDGAAAGQITSAAELRLASGVRNFALAMLRAEAEQGDRPLGYTAGSNAGTARVLAAPPALR